MGGRIRHSDHVALTSPTRGGLYVGIVRSRTQATEFSSVGNLSQVIQAIDCHYADWATPSVKVFMVGVIRIV
jgi:hypothetical protein